MKKTFLRNKISTTCWYILLFIANEEQNLRDGWILSQKWQKIQTSLKLLHTTEAPTQPSILFCKVIMAKLLKLCLWGSSLHRLKGEVSVEPKTAQVLPRLSSSKNGIPCNAWGLSLYACWNMKLLNWKEKESKILYCNWQYRKPRLQIALENHCSDLSIHFKDISKVDLLHGHLTGSVLRGLTWFLSSESFCKILRFESCLRWAAERSISSSASTCTQFNSRLSHPFKLFLDTKFFESLQWVCPSPSREQCPPWCLRHRASSCGSQHQNPCSDAQGGLATFH